MKFLFDFLPVLLFFVTYKIWGIYWATGVLMVSSVLQIAGLLIAGKKPQTTHWITIGLAVPLGAMTLLLHNPIFVKWKPTLVNWLFAAVFTGSLWIGEKTMIERMMGHAMKLPSKIWRQLNIGWVVFFIASGGLNLVVAYACSENTWVNFKLFGMMGLTIAFAIGQTFFMQKHLLEENVEHANATKDIETPPAS